MKNRKKACDTPDFIILRHIFHIVIAELYLK